MPDGGDDGDEKNPNKVDPEALERALEKLCVTKCTKMDMTNHKTAYNALRRIAKRFIIKKLKVATIPKCERAFWIVNFSLCLKKYILNSSIVSALF